MAITFSGQQIQGDRSYQEDSFQILKDVQFSDGKTGLLLILCDGMGGHAGGDIASELVCNTFRQVFDDSSATVIERFKQALEKAQQAVVDHIKEHAEHQTMGTTLIAVCIIDKQLYWISIGDSPLWLLREGKLNRLNADHSMGPIFDKMVELGELTAEAAASDPKRHALRSVVNGETIRDIDISEDAFSIQKNDQFILASDGVETLDNEAIIASIIQENHQPCEVVLENLLKAVTDKNKQNQDNASAILVQINIDEASSAAETVDKEEEQSRANNRSSHTKVVWLLMFFIIITMVLLAYIIKTDNDITSDNETQIEQNVESEDTSDSDIPRPAEQLDKDSPPKYSNENSLDESNADSEDNDVDQQDNAIDNQQTPSLIELEQASPILPAKEIPSQLDGQPIPSPQDGNVRPIKQIDEQLSSPTLTKEP